MKTRLMVMAGAVALVLDMSPAQAQAPVITSFGSNGELICTNLQPGTAASVEWAASVTGPWTNSWAALAAVTADTNGAIRVIVPMFYRVRGTPRPTNPPPPASMVLIPAGTFTMGNNFTPSEGGTDELPLHSVYVSAFYMDKYHVTKALWDQVYNWATNHGYSFDASDSGQGKAANHPAHTMTWYDAVKWCNARSEEEGRVPAYYTSAGLTNVYRGGQTDVQNNWVNWGSGYRLPTEAEWEKAARGGASGQRFPWGNTISESQANYGADPANYSYDLGPYTGFNTNYTIGGTPYTSPVGSFAPNGYGLYDIAGNVWQWCWDWWGDYPGSAQTDPRGPASYHLRVLRGASWYDSAFMCRAAMRASNYPVFTSYYMGFRLVLPPGQ